MEFIKIPGDPASHDDYMRGYEDGVEYVLSLMDSYVNRLALDGELYAQARACEDMLEDIKETLDNE